MTPEGFITIKEAMQTTGLARATIFKLLKEHEIERFEVAGSREVLIRKSDLEDLRRPKPRERPARTVLPAGGRSRGDDQGAGPRRAAAPGRCPGDHHR
jgi:excisionase family DNA binding protein